MFKSDVIVYLVIFYHFLIFSSCHAFCPLSSPVVTEETFPGMTNKAPEQQLVTSRLKELQKGCALLCEHPTPISPGETGNWELLAALGQYM